MKYLEHCGFEFEGSHCVVIGRSKLVGKPMAQLLLDKNATVTVCHSKTQNLDKFIRSADLVVCAVGKPNFLNCYSLYMPIIDVGTNFIIYTLKFLWQHFFSFLQVFMGIFCNKMLETVKSWLK